MFRFVRKNIQGISLVEMLISVALLGIFSTATYKGITVWKKDLAVLKRKVTSEDITASIRKSLSSKGAFLQVDYSDTSAVAILSDPNNLPMAWSTDGIVTPIVDCKNSCPQGRYGYVLKPVAGSRGLYHMTIKITHIKWDEDKFFNVLVGD